MVQVAQIIPEDFDWVLAATANWYTSSVGNVTFFTRVSLETSSQSRKPEHCNSQKLTVYSIGHKKSKFSFLPGRADRDCSPNGTKIWCNS